MKYIPKYYIRNFDGRILVRNSQNEITLEIIRPDELLTNPEVLLFDSIANAEDFIWRHEFLELDVTLRVVQI